MRIIQTELVQREADKRFNLWGLVPDKELGSRWIVLDVYDWEIVIDD